MAVAAKASSEVIDVCHYGPADTTDFKGALRALQDAEITCHRNSWVILDLHVLTHAN